MREVMIRCYGEQKKEGEVDPSPNNRARNVEGVDALIQHGVAPAKATVQKAL
jgi:hypothetical protein